MDPLEGRCLVRLSREINSTTNSGIADTVWPMPYAGDTLFFSQGEYDGSRALISSALPLSSILGLLDHGEEKRAQRSFLTDRPEKVRYDGRVDRELYAGGPVGGVLAMQARPITKAILWKEHGTRHVRWNGRVGDKEILDNYREYPDRRAPVYGEAEHPFYQKFRGTSGDQFRLSGVTAGGYMTFEVDPSSEVIREEANLDAFAHAQRQYKRMLDGEEFLRTRGYWVSKYRPVHNHSVHDKVNDLDRWLVDISYVYRLDYAPYIWPGRYWVEWLVNVKFTYQYRPAYGSALASTWNKIPDEAWSFLDQSSVTLNAWNGDNGSFPEPVPILGFNLSSRIVAYSSIYQLDDANRYWFDQFRTGEGRSARWRDVIISRAVDENMAQIRPSSFIAASKAFDDNTLILKANTLQDLQHLPGIVQLLPDLGELAKIVAKCFDGDPSAIKDLIDFITEEILKIRFQRKPLQKDIDDALSVDDYDTLLRGITRTRTVTIKGKFEYVFTDAENFIHDGRLTLTTRAQIEVRFDLSTVLAGMLTARSLGLLPTLASIWNLLPFSFVVDWFTNMTKRLHLVDNAVLFQTLAINYCLWSYEVNWYPSDEMLRRYNLVNIDPDKPFHLSVYARELSSIMPRLRDSKFDFLRPSQRPDLITVGALLWQLFS